MQDVNTNDNWKLSTWFPVVHLTLMDEYCILYLVLRVKPVHLFFTFIFATYAKGLYPTKKNCSSTKSITFNMYSNLYVSDILIPRLTLSYELSTSAWYIQIHRLDTRKRRKVKRESANSSCETSRNNLNTSAVELVA